MLNVISLNDCWEPEGCDGRTELELVRLDASQTAVVPFTTDGVRVELHYLSDPEVRGFVRCNGDGCVLCRAGRAQEAKLLFPVYLPASRRVGVLPISTNARPGALGPQFRAALQTAAQAGKRVALLIHKPDQVSFRVQSVPLTEGMDDGAGAVQAFRLRWEAGEVDLTSVYQRLDNRELEALPGVAAVLRLKGGDGATDQR
jgi:hypothetical protein